MSALDDLFGGSGFEPSAVDTFTDRVPESVAFRRAVESHLDRLEAVPDSDPRHPRSNVVSFYGIGGLGKTSLSIRLEEWMTGGLGDGTEWGSPPEVSRRLLTTRLNLDERKVFDVERAVLELRATAGSLDVPTDAFDIALAIWWRQYHGDQPIPQLASRSTTSDATNKADLHDQLRDTSTAVLEEIGAGFGLANLGMRVAQRTYSAVKRRRARTRALDNPWFDSVVASLERKVDLEELSKLPVLLGWDLRQQPVEERPLWIVFVDTFEHANGDEARRGEREFQRLVIGLPDVLWIVTGRSRLDWSDRERTGALDWVGPERWPGLAAAATEPAQHLVGDLSNEDARRYIERATADLSDATIPTATIDVIVKRAAGSPLFLDRYVQLLRETIANGDEPDPTSFDLSFAGLVERVLRDLPAEDRQALQLACLFPRCSAALIAETSHGTVSEAALHRLRYRGLASPQPWPLFALKVHDSIRAQIRLTSPDNGGWTDGDWQTYAQRGLDAIRHHHDQHRDPERRLDCFSLAMSVALEFDIPAPWLINAAGSLPTMELAAQAIPPIPPNRQASWAAHLAAMLHCWTGADDGVRRAERLHHVIDTPGIPPDVYRSAQRFRAYNLRNHGQWHEALAIFEQLIGEGTRSGWTLDQAVVNRRQRCFILNALGRFADSAAEDPMLVDGGSPTAAMEALRATRARFHGEMADAAKAFRLRYEDTKSAGRLRIARENLADEQFARAWLSPPDTSTPQVRREEIARDGLGNHYVTACTAVALAAAGSDVFSTSQRELEHAFDLPPEPGDSGRSNVWQLHLPPAFDAAIRGDLRELRSRIDQIDHPVYRVTTSFWLPLVDPGALIPGNDVQWLEPGNDVIERWHQLVIARRRAVGRDPATGVRRAIG